jgi:hypothetical protein
MWTLAATQTPVCLTALGVDRDASLGETRSAIAPRDPAFG